MNIFQYKGQEGEHYTNILLGILNDKDHLLLPQFIAALIPQASQDFQYDSLTVHFKKKHCPRPQQPYEYVIGIAPNTSDIQHSELEDTTDSTPTAWICGGNFNLLFEFKTRGTLDEGQIAAHKRLIGKEDAPVIRLTWEDVMESLEKIHTDDAVMGFLLKSFRTLEVNFSSEKRDLDVPKEIISGIDKSDELYFLITGSKSVRPYKVEKVVKGDTELLVDDLQDITTARKFIAQYVTKNKDTLPIEYKGKATIISEYYVAPGRAEKKNVWNQWRLGSYNKNITT